MGRPSKWGNPYTHLPIRSTSAEYLVADRDAAVESYRDWIKTQPHLIAALDELRGRDLACWCAPLRCHADVLLELANG